MFITFSDSVSIYLKRWLRLITLIGFRFIWKHESTFPWILNLRITRNNRVWLLKCLAIYIHTLNDLSVIKENKTGFRQVSRQQQDRFRNKLFCHLFADFSGPAFWHTFLSMQYKSLFTDTLVCCTFLGGRVCVGECKSLS